MINLEQYAEKFRFVGLLFEILIITMKGISFLFQKNPLWVDFVFDIYTPFLLYALIITQQKNLKKNNIDFFSILILILFRTYSFNTNYSIDQKTLLIGINILFSGLFIYVLYKERKTIQIQFSPNQVLFFVIGLLIGIGIASFKLFFDQSQIFRLVIDYPKYYLFSLLNGFSLSMLSEEFIFRGYIWKYLIDKGLNKKWVLIISSSFWAILHVFKYPDFFSIVNFLFLGIVFGLLVIKTKSLNSSIGAHVGYNSFIIFQSLIM